MGFSPEIFSKTYAMHDTPLAGNSDFDVDNGVSDNLTTYAGLEIIVTTEKTSRCFTSNER